MNKKISAFLISISPLFANPADMQVVSGSASLNPQTELLEITASDRSILNWNTFSIDANEVTRFILPSADSAVLNRVTGSQMSEIMGSLESNGKVYLTNPNGIVIGAEGRIDTAAFIASTLEIRPEEFLENGDLHLIGTDFGTIVNLGTIIARDGPVALLGHRVENEGSIATDGKVSLVAAQDILLQTDGSSLIYIKPELPSGGIEQMGTIEALEVALLADGPHSLAIQMGSESQGEVLVFEGGSFFLKANGSVNISGTIQAPSGDVYIYGDQITLTDGQIDVSGNGNGGEVLIGQFEKGNYAKGKNSSLIDFQDSFSINADSLSGGDGGHVLLLSDKVGAFFGSITARSLGDFGSGGLVELSGRGVFLARTLSDVRSENGPWGKVVHDPLAITIQHGANTAPVGNTYNDAYIADQLSMGNYTITTAPDAGVITFTDSMGAVDIEWSEATRFQLLGESIFTTSTVTISNLFNSPTPFTAIDFRANTGNGVPAGVGNFSGINLEGTVNFSTLDGGGVNLEGRGGTTANVYNGVFLITFTLTTTNGDVTITGEGGGAAGATASGIYLFQSAFNTESSTMTFTGTGSQTATTSSNMGVRVENTDFSMSAASNGGALTFTGQGGLSGLDTNYGVKLDTVTMTTNSSPIVVTGYAGGTGSDSYGVYIIDLGITGSNDASLTVAGTGPTTGLTGAGTSSNTSNGIGVFMQGATLAFETGDIAITGSGKATTLGGTGIATVSGVAISTTTGTITLRGDASQNGSSGSNMGISIDDESGSNPLVSTSGNILLVGTGGLGSNSGGINIISSKITEGTSFSRSVNGNVTLQGTGSGGNNGIHFNEGNGPLTTGSGNILLETFGSPLAIGGSGNSFFVTTGSGNLTFVANDSNIVAFPPNAFTLHLATRGTGNISLSAGETILTNHILIEAANAGTVTLQATNGNVSFFNQNVITTVDGNVLVIAGVNIQTSGGILTATDISITTTGASSTITLVVDNLNPTPPGIGSGIYYLPNTAVFSSSKVNFYAGVGGTSIFPDTINGLAYTPGFTSGGVYFPGTNELVGYWFGVAPFPPTLDIFQINYKASNTPASLVPPNTDPAVVAVTQIGNISGQVSSDQLPIILNFDISRSCRPPTVSVSP